MAGTIRVLVVDEDEDVLDLTATFLERESDSISAETESDAERALTRAIEEPFDCVVSDYRMPGMDGMELFEEIRGEGVEVPFVLFSAAVEDETVEKAQRVGVTDFIKKGAGTDHYREMVATIEDSVAD